MYTNSASRKHPGLVILMVDQSNSMSNESVANGKPLAVIAADSINLVLSEMIKNATRPKGDDDEEVRDYQKVIVIGYGGDENCQAQVLVEDYLSQISSKYPKEKRDTIAGRLDIHNIIKPVAGYVTPMASAFLLAKLKVDEWKTEGSGHDGPEDPSPIIINITDGAPTDNEGYVTEESLSKTYEEAQALMNISFPDGAPRIFNIMISQTDGSEIRFPDNENVLEGDLFAKFLFLISSTVTEDLKARISAVGLGDTNANSKVLLMNVNDPNVLVNILKVGTIVKVNMR